MASKNRPAGDLERKRAANGLPEKNGNGHHQIARPAPPVRARRRSPWWRGLVLPALIGLACGGGAYVYSTHYVKPLYSAGSTLWFPSSGGTGVGGILGPLMGMGALPGADPAGNISVLGGIYSAPQFGSGPGTAMAAMSTARCQSLVFTRLNLAKQWHLPVDKAVARLNKSVSYGIDKNGFLAIQATDPDPRMAVKLVNAYVEAMKDVSTQMNVDYTSKVRRQVEDTYQNRRAQLERQNAQLVALQTGEIRRMPLGDAAATTYDDLVKQKISTQTELNATTTALQKQIQTARRTYSRGTDLPASVSFAGDTLTRLRKAESDFRAAQDEFGPDNPDYQRAEDALTRARAEAKTEAQRQISAVNLGLTSNVSDLVTKQATLQGQLDYIEATMAPIKDVMVSLPAAKAREDQLTADIRANRGLVDQLKAALQQAQLAEGRRRVPSFTVIDGAVVPSDPSEPHPTRTAILAAIAGILLALAFQVARAIARQPAVTDDLRRWTDRYGLTEADELDDEEYEALSGVSAALSGRGAPQLPVSDDPAETPLPAVEERVGERRP